MDLEENPGKRVRKNFGYFQRSCLRKLYAITKFPSKLQKEDAAAFLELTMEQVEQWFQNARRRIIHETDSEEDILKKTERKMKKKKVKLEKTASSKYRTEDIVAKLSIVDAFAETKRREDVTYRRQARKQSRDKIKKRLPVMDNFEDDVNDACKELMEFCCS